MYGSSGVNPIRNNNSSGSNNNSSYDAASGINAQMFGFNNMMDFVNPQQSTPQQQQQQHSRSGSSGAGGGGGSSGNYHSMSSNDMMMNSPYAQSPAGSNRNVNVGGSGGGGGVGGGGGGGGHHGNYPPPSTSSYHHSQQQQLQQQHSNKMMQSSSQNVRPSSSSSSNNYNPNSMQMQQQQHSMSNASSNNPGMTPPSTQRTNSSMSRGSNGMQTPNSGNYYPSSANSTPNPNMGNKMSGGGSNAGNLPFSPNLNMNSLNAMGMQNDLWNNLNMTSPNPSSNNNGGYMDNSMGGMGGLNSPMGMGMNKASSGGTSMLSGTAPHGVPPIVVPSSSISASKSKSGAAGTSSASSSAKKKTTTASIPPPAAISIASAASATSLPGLLSPTLSLDGGNTPSGASLPGGSSDLDVIEIKPPRVDLKVRKQSLDKLLGDQETQNQYWNLVEKYLLVKLSKQELDSFVLSKLGPQNLHVHNDFFLAVLQNAHSDELPPKPSKKKPTTATPSANGAVSSAEKDKDGKSKLDGGKSGIPSVEKLKREKSGTSVSGDKTLTPSKSDKSKEKDSSTKKKKKLGDGTTGVEEEKSAKKKKKKEKEEKKALKKKLKEKRRQSDELEEKSESHKKKAALAAAGGGASGKKGAGKAGGKSKHDDEEVSSVSAWLSSPSWFKPTVSTAHRPMSHMTKAAQYFAALERTAVYGPTGNAHAEYGNGGGLDWQVDSWNIHAGNAFLPPHPPPAAGTIYPAPKVLPPKEGPYQPPKMPFNVSSTSTIAHAQQILKELYQPLPLHSQAFGARQQAQLDQVRAKSTSPRVKTESKSDHNASSAPMSANASTSHLHNGSASFNNYNGGTALSNTLPSNYTSNYASHWDYQQASGSERETSVSRKRSSRSWNDLDSQYSSSDYDSEEAGEHDEDEPMRDDDNDGDATSHSEVDGSLVHYQQLSDADAQSYLRSIQSQPLPDRDLIRKRLLQSALQSGVRHVSEGAVSLLQQATEQHLRTIIQSILEFARPPIHGAAGRVVGLAVPSAAGFDERIPMSSQTLFPPSIYAATIAANKAKAAAQVVAPPPSSSSVALIPADSNPANGVVAVAIPNSCGTPTSTIPVASTTITTVSTTLAPSTTSTSTAMDTSDSNNSVAIGVNAAPAPPSTTMAPATSTGATPTASFGVTVPPTTTQDATGDALSPATLASVMQLSAADSSNSIPIDATTTAAASSAASSAAATTSSIAGAALAPAVASVHPHSLAVAAGVSDIMEDVLTDSQRLTMMRKVLTAPPSKEFTDLPPLSIHAPSFFSASTVGTTPAAKALLSLQHESAARYVAPSNLLGASSSAAAGEHGIHVPISVSEITSDALEAHLAHLNQRDVFREKLRDHTQP